MKAKETKKIQALALLNVISAYEKLYLLFFGEEKMKKKYIGSKFDDFLEEENLLEDAAAVAAKRVFVFQLEKEMKKQKLDKSEFAERLQTSRSAVDRILDPECPSTLKTFAKAARALGKHLKVSIV